jgi:hypothetical protein
LVEQCHRVLTIYISANMAKEIGAFFNLNHHQFERGQSLEAVDFLSLYGSEKPYNRHDCGFTKEFETIKIVDVRERCHNWSRRSTADGLVVDRIRGSVTRSRTSFAAISVTLGHDQILLGTRWPPTDVV